MLTQAEAREWFDYSQDDGILTNRIKRNTRSMPGTEAGTFHKKGYRQVNINYKLYKTHRLVWLWMTGSFPSGVIDHINGDNSDNRWENLRDVEVRDNQINQPRRVDNKSGVMGVWWEKDRGRWQVRINGKYEASSRDYFEAVCMRKSAELRECYHPNHGRAA